VTRSPGGPAARAAAAFRGSLWPLPTLGVAVAVGLGVALPALDRALGLATGSQPLALVFSGGPSAARALLSAIATALISVTGLVFSLTVVALQLSSSQYSPRLLQTFVTDRVVQLTLTQLVLTFVYSLTVLRTVRSAADSPGEASFVPGISVTVATVLTLASVVALVLFLGHLSRALRVDTMLRDVHQEATAAVGRVLGDRDDQDEEGDEAPPDFPGTAVPVEASSSGFLVAVDERALAHAAGEADVVLRLALRVGDGVVAGTPIAHAWSTGASGRVDVDAAAAALERGVHLAHERQSTEDYSYALRKMADIAVRALSPGINDPTTAVSALSHLSAVLVAVADRRLLPRCLRDEHGRVRVVVPGWDHAALLRLAVEEPLQCAGGQPEVLRGIARLLREVAWRAGPGPQATELRRLAGRVADTATGSTDVSDAEVRRWRADVDAAIAGRWPPESA
jgi:uncharacterized membrane protein